MTLLHAQFGRGTAQIFHFRPTFRQALDLALAVYPDAQVEVDERGVVLKPSRPPVAPKTVSLQSGKASRDNERQAKAAKPRVALAALGTVQGRLMGL